MLRLALALMISLMGVGTAEAFTCTATGCTFTITYREPTTNTAGGPPQLTSTTAFYTISSNPEKSVVTPASSPNGGGTITKTITEPILPGQIVTIGGAALATNPAGPSARATVAAPLVIDRSAEVVTNPPSNATIQ